MDESLSNVASVLSGAAMEPEPETAALPEPETPLAETPESAIAEPDPPPLPATEAKPPEKAKPSMTVKQLAEKLDVRPQDVYQQLMIDVGSGERLSLSELKDAGAKLHKAETILADAETHRLGAENELLRKQHAVSLREPTEAEQADADAHWQDYLGKENARTLAVISAWKDPHQQRADLAAMSELLGSYGVSAAEISRYADHRMVKQLYDHMTLKARLEHATQAEVTKTPAPVVKAKRKVAHKPGKAAVEQYYDGKLGHSETVAALIAEG